MIILSTTRHHEGQEIEIFVSYDVATNEVKEIKNIWLKTHGKRWPVGNFFVHIPELEEAVNKIIDATDWRQEYRDMIEIPERECILDPVIQQSLSSFTQHIGGR